MCQPRPVGSRGFVGAVKVAEVQVLELLQISH